MRSISRLAAASALTAALIAPAAQVQAAGVDPGVVQMTAFDDALLSSMKQADALGVRGRYAKLEPAVERAFDLPTMTRYAIGPAWAKFSSGDQKLLINAFSRLTIASFAHNFAGYDGERFVVEPTPVNRGPDKIVSTQIVPEHGSPVVLAYRMRETGGTWKTIDVLFQGTISQLTTRRSDLAAIVATGDAKTIAANINAQADKLLAK
jgi:phospholipid transport system substrate-binding protein